jgi:hypothetical protein
MLIAFPRQKWLRERVSGFTFVRTLPVLFGAASIRYQNIKIIFLWNMKEVAGFVSLTK